MLPFRLGLILGAVLLVASANGAAIVSFRIVNESQEFAFVCLPVSLAEWN